LLTDRDFADFLTSRGCSGTLTNHRLKCAVDVCRRDMDDFTVVAVMCGQKEEPQELPPVVRTRLCVVVVVIIVVAGIKAAATTTNKSNKLSSVNVNAFQARICQHYGCDVRSVMQCANLETKNNHRRRFACFYLLLLPLCCSFIVLGARHSILPRTQKSAAH
jgi:hypothetical protein